jgi:hypothetical protein
LHPFLESAQLFWALVRVFGGKILRWRLPIDPLVNVRREEFEIVARDRVK